MNGWEGTRGSEAGEPELRSPQPGASYEGSEQRLPGQRIAGYVTGWCTFKNISCNIIGNEFVFYMEHTDSILCKKKTVIK